MSENGPIDYRQWAYLSPGAVFLLVHGLGAHAGRWDFLVDFFATRGFISYAADLRDFRDYYNKIARLRGSAAKDNPGKPIFLIGESFGAIVSLLTASREPDLFNGLICISPAFANRVRPAPIEQLKIAASLFYNPNKQFKLPFDSSMCTRDTDYIKKMDEDSREYRTVSSRSILDILLAQARSRGLKDIKPPVLFLLAGEDKLVDPAAARKIFNGLEVKDKTLIEFPGMYHSLSIELGKEKVFVEMLKWVEQRIAT